MDGRDSIDSLLVLRKLTRAISDVLRGQVVEYLATLTPLLRARAVLGEYIQGAPKEPVRKADKAFKELQALYENIAPGKPFNLPREFPSPIPLPGILNLEITPFEYAHTARGKTLSVRTPLTWVLSYSGFTPARLNELLANKTRSVDDLQQILLAYLVMHVVVSNQPGVSQMLEGLYFPVSTTTSPDYGELPLTVIRSSITTGRASDDLVIESAELTGMDAFEEVVNIDDIERLGNPFKERLTEIVRSHAPERA
jgi:hypothetical protein